MKKLHASQIKAITTGSRYSLILAGAGSGKTTTIIKRVEHLLRQGYHHISGDNILILTFSNKAAGEIKARIKHVNGGHRVWLGTFHSFALRILRKYNNNAEVADEDQALELLIEASSEIQGKTSKTKAEEIMYEIQNFKDRLTTPPQSHNNIARIGEIYDCYQQKLRDKNMMDFGDILVKLRELFLDAPNIWRFHQNKFKHILVDEYQDVNFAQYTILRMMLQMRTNSLYCVADDDQLIYGWRGANIGNILNFTKHFPDSEIIKLCINYRSTKLIVSSSSFLIAHNENRHTKDIESYDLDESAEDKIHLHCFRDNKDEAYGIAALVEKMLVDFAEQRTPNNFSIGILLRRNAQMRDIKEALATFDIDFEDEAPATLSNDINVVTRNTAPTEDVIATNKATVSIMTIHSAKGMEFDAVFLPAWEEGILPDNEDSLEEERRVAYVAITRAKRHVLISYARSRMLFGRIEFTEKSRFITELPSQNCILFDHTR